VKPILYDPPYLLLRAKFVKWRLFSERNDMRSFRISKNTSKYQQKAIQTRFCPSSDQRGRLVALAGLEFRAVVARLSPKGPPAPNRVHHQKRHKKKRDKKTLSSIQNNPRKMSHMNPSHRRTHNLLLISKLLSPARGRFALHTRP